MCIGVDIDPSPYDYLACHACHTHRRILVPPSLFSDPPSQFDSAMEPTATASGGEASTTQKERGMALFMVLAMWCHL